LLTNIDRLLTVFGLLSANKSSLLTNIGRLLTVFGLLLVNKSPLSVKKGPFSEGPLIVSFYKEAGMSSF
jgi:hypothetical protein